MTGVVASTEEWGGMMLTQWTCLTSLVLSFALGCAHDIAGTHPHDVSQHSHEAAAAHHVDEATGHAANYDEHAKTDPEDCAQYLGSCWGSNPTERHEHAAEHRRVAAAHRSAAEALRNAEARACRGVPEADRDISPFFHREAILDVRRLTRDKGSGPASVRQDAGATIVLLPAVGVTAERLQRVVECHLSRNAALGHDVPEMAYCPLVPNGVAANVSSAANGFAVNISSEDPATAAEILRRARTLVSQ